MSDFIGVDVSGEDALILKLKALPDEVRNEAVDAASVYLINVLKAYPGPRYVTRKAAYGQTFFTEKQRRWFFAALADGLRIPYGRTQQLSKAWKQVGRGYTSIIANETPYAGYVMGDGTQSRHEAMVGWKTVGTIVQERMKRLTEVIDGAAKRALKKIGL